MRAGWKWAILAGLIGGLAIFVKFVAAFFVIGGALGALLGRYKLRDLIRNPQVWTLGALGVLPGGAWIIYGKLVLGIFGGDMSGRFIPSLLASPLFYVQWQVKAAAVAGGLGIMFGLIGLFLVSGRARAFLFGIWGAYFVFGLYFNYHISTHDYYSMSLLPIVALSLVPLGDRFFARLAGDRLRCSPRRAGRRFDVWCPVQRLGCPQPDEGRRLPSTGGDFCGNRADFAGRLGGSADAGLRHLAGVLGLAERQYLAVIWRPVPGQRAR